MRLVKNSSISFAFRMLIILDKKKGKDGMRIYTDTDEKYDVRDGTP